MMREPSPPLGMRTRWPLALAGGFLLSFGTMLVLPLLRSNSLTGQLLAGDPTVNRQYPTTLNMVHASISGQSTMLHNLGSMGWWMMVMVGTIVGAFFFLALLRRVA